MLAPWLGALLVLTSVCAAAEVDTPYLVMATGDAALTLSDMAGALTIRLPATRGLPRRAEETAAGVAATVGDVSCRAPVGAPTANCTLPPTGVLETTGVARVNGSVLHLAARHTDVRMTVTLLDGVWSDGPRWTATAAHVVVHEESPASLVNRLRIALVTFVALAPAGLVLELVAALFTRRMRRETA